jgi:hypothetical protein
VVGTVVDHSSAAGGFAAAGIGGLLIALLAVLLTRRQRTRTDQLADQPVPAAR